MGRNSCSACTMINAGVKTRKALTHTCGRPKRSIPKKFSIPKVDESNLFNLVIQRGNIVQTDNAIKVYLAAQEFEGVKIPRGFEVWAPNKDAFITKEYSAFPQIVLRGWKVNEILRTLVIRNL